MGWREYREHHLRRLEEAERKGEIDIPILPVLRFLNSFEDIVTTSSCSGRIVLLQTDLEESKRSSSFFRKWHKPVIVENVIKAFHSFEGDFLWFKMEPFILHVATKDLDMAKLLIEVSRRSGVKIAGVQSFGEDYYHVEIRNVEYLSMPVVWERERIVSDEYLRKVTLIANWKMVKNQRRLETFYENLLNTLNPLI